MSEKLYYTAPSDKMFFEIKRAAAQVWGNYDNTHGYVDEKLAIIEPLQNVSDNYMYIVAMFDHNNQIQLLSKLTLETRLRVKAALK